MIKCQNCGNTNTIESNYCRFCGTRFPVQQANQQQQQQDYDFSPPRPYAWKTDEFQTQVETRVSTGAPVQPYQPYSVAPPYLCRNCLSMQQPQIERRISTTGWIVFAVLLVLFFPLFWIGLLIKEDVQVCPVCKAKNV